MDQELLRNIVAGLQWVTTCFLAFYAHNIGKQKATTDSLDKLKDDLNQKCLRIAKLEGEIKAMPTQDQVIRLHDRIDEILETNRQTNFLLGELNGKVSERRKLD